MSLCLIDVHGDIEGDFEWVVDLPRNATNGDIIRILFGYPEKETDDSILFKAKWGKTKKKYFYTHFNKEWMNLPVELKGAEEYSK